LGVLFKNMVNKTAVAIIVNLKGEFLLQKKTMDYVHFPGKWGFFGGGIEKNESAEDAIRRELFEESGIKFNNFKLFSKKEHIINEYKYEESVFILKFDKSISEIRLGEGSGFAFFNKDELSSIDLFSEARKIIEKYIKTIQ
jgi:8-oxo-dGTP diphosphatase